MALQNSYFLPLSQLEFAISETERDGKIRFVYPAPQVNSTYANLFFFEVTKDSSQLSEEAKQVVNYLKTVFLASNQPKLPVIQTPEKFDKVESPSVKIGVRLGLKIPTSALALHTTLFSFVIFSDNHERIYSNKIQTEYTTNIILGFPDLIQIQRLREACPSGIIKFHYQSHSSFPENSNLILRTLLDQRQISNGDERLKIEIQNLNQKIIQILKNEAILLKENCALRERIRLSDEKEAQTQSLIQSQKAEIQNLKKRLSSQLRLDLNEYLGLSSHIPTLTFVSEPPLKRSCP